VGDEEKWWRERQIDPIVHAEQLWRERWNQTILQPSRARELISPGPRDLYEPLSTLLGISTQS
jgi:hypothetical protein